MGLEDIVRGVATIKKHTVLNWRRHNFEKALEEPGLLNMPSSSREGNLSTQKAGADIV